MSIGYLPLFKLPMTPLLDEAEMNKISKPKQLLIHSGGLLMNLFLFLGGSLLARGSISQKGVNKKNNYLIVGGKGSSAWSAGNYSNKVKRALELQESGSEIRIVREHDIL